MLDVDLHNIVDLLTQGLIKVTFVYPITKKHHFKLLSPLSIKLSNNDIIKIPSDFKFDGSSSPRFLWWLFPSYGDFFIGALIHDYLYHTRKYSDEIGLDKAQLFADKEMLYWSNRTNNKNIGKIWDNYLRYYAVRLFGKKVYIT